MGLAGITRSFRILGVGKTAHLLVGSLSHSGKWRAALAPSEDQPHLVASPDRLTRGLGRVTRSWRFDRAATATDANGATPNMLLRPCPRPPRRRWNAP